MLEDILDYVTKKMLIMLQILYTTSLVVLCMKTFIVQINILKNKK